MVNVQVGDKVKEFAYGSMHTTIEKVVTVTKVTATQITVSSGYRYMKSTGYRVGEANKTRGWFHSIKEVA